MIYCGEQRIPGKYGLHTYNMHKYACICMYETVKENGIFVIKEGKHMVSNWLLVSKFQGYKDDLKGWTIRFL